MTTDEYIAKLQSQLQQIEQGAPLFIAANTVVANMVDRIFTKGLNTAGDEIGQYNSTDEIYVDPLISPGKKFPPKGKNSQEVFASGKKSGQQHKRGWFDSYKSYRETIGRPTAKVNLNLSGELKSDLESGLRKVSISEYILIIQRDIDNKKRLGNEKEDRFGKIFSLTKEEKKKFKDVYQFEVNKLVKK